MAARWSIPTTTLTSSPGQGTVGLEIAADAEALGLVPDMVVVPCSGGGLGAGIGLAMRAAFPDCETVLVEPEGFDDYARSLHDGRIVANATPVRARSATR